MKKALKSQPQVAIKTNDDTKNLEEIIEEQTERQVSVCDEEVKNCVNLLSIYHHKPFFYLYLTRYHERETDKESVEFQPLMKFQFH